VRELRNLIERTLILGRFPDDFVGHNNGTAPAGPPGDSLEDVERRHILAVLREAGGNRTEAARRLGVSRKTIDRKCAAWNV
jgi:DNA-binding NtrC family response regulator